MNFAEVNFSSSLHKVMFPHRQQLLVTLGTRVSSSYQKARGTCIRRLSMSRHTGSGSRFVLETIIGTNVIVFVAWQAAMKDYQLNSFMKRHFTTSSIGVIYRRDYHTLITSAFSHISVWHLAGNMLVLYSFGFDTLTQLGSSRFLLLYLGGGLVSSLALVAWPSVIPRSWPAYYQYDHNAVGLGASGAVNAVIAWSIFKWPRSIIYLYGVLPLPAALLGVGFICYDAVDLYYGSTRNVGNASHLCGAVYGALFYAGTRRLSSYRRF